MTDRPATQTRLKHVLLAMLVFSGAFAAAAAGLRGWPERSVAAAWFLSGAVYLSFCGVWVAWRGPTLPGGPWRVIIAALAIFAPYAAFALNECLTNGVTNPGMIHYLPIGPGIPVAMLIEAPLVAAGIRITVVGEIVLAAAAVVAQAFAPHYFGMNNNRRFWAVTMLLATFHVLASTFLFLLVLSAGC